jgi:hypothetical protein
MALAMRMQRETAYSQKLRRDHSFQSRKKHAEESNTESQRGKFDIPSCCSRNTDHDRNQAQDNIRAGHVKRTEMRTDATPRVELPVGLTQVQLRQQHGSCRHSRPHHLEKQQ